MYHGFVIKKNNLGFIAPPANTLHLSHVTMLVRKGESSNSAHSTLLDHTHSLHSGRGHTTKKRESHCTVFHKSQVCLKGELRR